ncbi:MAG: hypothetical protein RL722_1490, partial [Pseudomonadota bacterium]
MLRLWPRVTPGLIPLFLPGPRPMTAQPSAPSPSPSPSPSLASAATPGNTTTTTRDGGSVVLPATAAPGAAPAVPRPASTTIVLRDARGGAVPGSAPGIEVLMLLRSAQASFMPATYVFPGGTVDQGDADELAAAGASATELDGAALARRLLLGEDERTTAGMAVAALRECLEECGVWLGLDLADGPAGDAMRARLASARVQLRSGEVKGFGALALSLGLPLATSALWSWSHWVTPMGLPKRFDTRFFIVAMPAGQTATVDAEETTALAWITPQDALARHAAGEFDLAFATRTTLEGLARHATVASALAAARALGEIPVIHPRVSRGAAGARVVLGPWDHAYAEVGRLDPAGHGKTASVLTPGQPVQIAPGVQRLTAPNPGRM